MDLERLRSVAQDCLSKHLYSSAIFIADKLVTLSDAEPSDVYLLAQAYFLGKHYRRALHLLRQEHLLTLDERFRYLAAKCLEAVKGWEECLALIGEEDADAETVAKAAGGQEEEMQDTQQGGAIKIQAAMCLLRGRAHEAMDNRARALHWYKIALQLDPFCYEAFEHLIDNHMLTSEEEISLLSSLKLKEDDHWLFLLYSCRAKKYAMSANVEQKFEELERGQVADSSSSDPSAAAAPTSTGTAEPCAREAGTSAEGEAVTSVVLWSLKDNCDLMASKADYFYHRGEYQRAYSITKSLLQKDPYHMACLPTHLASTLELGRKNELFIRAHRLVEEYPQKAIAWYAVGCYYYCIRQFDNARRHFCKATTLDSVFAEAWLGFGNSYAAQDESDQAMAAYRTAARLFSGLHLPALCIGMEYARTNNFNLAEQFFLTAQNINPQDPLVYNELGVLAFRNNDFVQAAKSLRKALSLVSAPVTRAWEPTMVNLGHCLRKQKNYEEAISWYQRALALCPQQGGTYGALGYTHHLQGRIRLALEYYHKALQLKPEDTFLSEMLTLAMMEECHEWAHGGDDSFLGPLPPLPPLAGGTRLGTRW